MTSRSSLAQLPLNLCALPDQPAVTVLSLGLGQDSVAMLYAVHHHPTFRQQFCPGRLVVVSSDTGDEHEGTIETQHRLVGWCQDHAIEYHHLTPDKGFHAPQWQSLTCPQLLGHHASSFTPTS